MFGHEKRRQQAVVKSEECPNLLDTGQNEGRPAAKALVPLLETVAVLISVLCLMLAIITIANQDFAVRLRYTGQIIVIGFLMSQCLQRILPFTLLLLEARFGSSKLQNYDGILRWSPVATQLNLLWRIVIFLSIVLPLALGVGYKTFTGGISIAHYDASTQYFGPNAPPGLQQNMAGLSILANATVPFLAAFRDDSLLPTEVAGAFHVYGFNLALLSNRSAAALDAPSPSYVTSLQGSLQSGLEYRLTAPVRGIVAHYNDTAEQRRNGTDAFWSSYFSLASPAKCALWNGYVFGFQSGGQATSDSEAIWDGSWVFLGVFPVAGVNQSDPSAMENAFSKTARKMLDQMRAVDKPIEFNLSS